MSHTDRVYLPFVVLEQAYFALIRCILLFPAIPKVFSTYRKVENREIALASFSPPKTGKTFHNHLVHLFGENLGDATIYIYITEAKSGEPVYYLFLILVFRYLFHKFAN